MGALGALRLLGVGSVIFALFACSGSETSVGLEVEVLPYPEDTIAHITADASGAIWSAGFATGNAIYLWDKASQRFVKKLSNAGFSAQSAGGDPVVTFIASGCCEREPLKAAILSAGEVVMLPPLLVEGASVPIIYGVDADDTVYAAATFAATAQTPRYHHVYRLVRGGSAWERLPGQGSIITAGLTQLRFTKDGRVLEVSSEGVSELRFVEPEFVRTPLARADDPALSGTAYNLYLAQAWGTEDLYAVVPGTYDLVRLRQGNNAWELVARPGRPPKVTHIQQSPLMTPDGNLWLFMRDGQVDGAHGILVVLRPGATSWQIVSERLPRGFVGWALPDSGLVVADGTDFNNFAAILRP